MEVHKYIWTTIFFILILTFRVKCNLKSKDSISRPNIIFIIADDLGWNDVGFHGSNQIPTPNIDALAYSGVILNNYYVNPICTPSRSALMTGKYPIHTGMQHSVLYASEPRGLPLTEKILPEYLKDLDYINHIVGKWHLGHYKKEYTPLYRGFDSHLGFWSGHQDYNDHSAEEQGMWGLDMRRGMEVAWDLHGKYSTDLFTDEAVKIIKGHNGSRPMFLYVAHAGVHSGNPYNPLPVPDAAAMKMSHIDHYQRRKYAGMVSKVDDSVGKIVNALSKKEMLSNSIIIFTSDNGGPASGFNINWASNWPLRGVKNTLWEGGVRGAALIWSPLLNKRKRVAKQMMHITDWLPTLYTAAGGDSRDISQDMDAIDLWKALVEDRPSNRTEILHNIDDIWHSAAITVGDWKLHLGTNYNGTWDGWYGPSGLHWKYNVKNVIDSLAGKAVNSVFDDLEPNIINKLRDDAKVICDEKINITCNPIAAPCLFNIKDDPCEKVNLADDQEYQEKLIELLERLIYYNNSAIPPGNLPLDPKGDPKLWNYTWTNFGDDITTQNCQNILSHQSFSNYTSSTTSVTDSNYDNIDTIVNQTTYSFPMLIIENDSLLENNETPQYLTTSEVDENTDISTNSESTTKT